MTTKTRIDITVRNEGTIFLFRPLTGRAEAWLDNNISDGATWFGGALVVEHRYARELALAMQEAGLVLK